MSRVSLESRIFPAADAVLKFFDILDFIGKIGEQIRTCGAISRTMFTIPAEPVDGQKTFVQLIFIDQTLVAVMAFAAL